MSKVFAAAATAEGDLTGAQRRVLQTGEYLPPNKILFIQNLPDTATKQELETLFSKYVNWGIAACHLIHRSTGTKILSKYGSFHQEKGLPLCNTKTRRAPTWRRMHCTTLGSGTPKAETGSKSLLPKHDPGGVMTHSCIFDRFELTSVNISFLSLPIVRVTSFLYISVFKAYSSETSGTEGVLRMDDERHPLLPKTPAEDRLPWGQLLILCLNRFTEPVCFQGKHARDVCILDRAQSHTVIFRKLWNQSCI